MKLSLNHIVIPLVVILGGFWSAPTWAQSADSAAIEVVHDYLQSLALGDTTRLRERMSGVDKTRHQRKLLQNPNYARRLQEAYANSTYGIVDSEQLTDRRARVDAEITLESGHPLNVRFVLEAHEHDGTYRIIEEI